MISSRSFLSTVGFPRVVCRVLLAFVVATATVTFAQDDAAAEDAIPELRISTAVSTADGLLQDLEFMISELADRGKIYNAKVVDNIEIFLFGVDRENPTRFDIIVPPEGERRLNMMVPVADAKDFRLDNVDASGINLQRKSSDYYELNGNVYEGFLRFLTEDEKDAPKGKSPRVYAVFAHIDAKDDAEISIEDVLNRNAKLFVKDFDAAALIDEDSGPFEGRDRLVAKLKSQALELMERRPDETEEAFALRKTIVELRYERLELVLVGGQRIAAGLKIDQDNQTSTLTFDVEPREETQFAEIVTNIGSIPSRFSAVPTSDDPVATARLSLMLHDERKQRLETSFDAVRTASLAEIEQSDDSPELIDARKTFTNLVFDQLIGGLAQDILSGFYEVEEAGDGHRFVMGSTTINGANIEAILDALPAAVENATVTKNAETIGELSMHKLSLPDISEALKSHLGGKTEFYVGFDSESVYLAGGPDCLELLKTAIAEVTPEKTDTVFSMRMHATPMAELFDAAMTTRGVSLIEFLQDRREERIESSDRDKDSVRRVEVTDPAKWRKAAIEALQKLDDADGDVITVDVSKVDGNLAGEIVSGPSLLAAIGELIAKFADENL